MPINITFTPILPGKQISIAGFTAAIVEAFNEGLENLEELYDETHRHWEAENVPNFQRKIQTSSQAKKWYGEYVARERIDVYQAVDGDPDDGGRFETEFFATYDWEPQTEPGSLLSKPKVGWAGPVPHPSLPPYRGIEPRLFTLTIADNLKELFWGYLDSALERACKNGTDWEPDRDFPKSP